MTKKIFKEISEKVHRSIEKMRQIVSPVSNRPADPTEDAQKGHISLWLFAYRFLGERTAMFLPLFKDADMNLQRSGMKVNFKAYVSLAILSTAILSAFALLLIPLVLFFVFKLSAVSSVLFGVGGGLFTMVLTLIGFYMYPILRADSLKRALEDGLPFISGYMAILAGAGVTVANMFRSLAQVDDSLAVSSEARTIVRDMKLFGMDVLSALDAASRRTPSTKFKELLEGIIATVHSGGNMEKYLARRADQFMRLKKIALRRFADTLGVLAEFYVVLLVAGPLILVVMLGVMAMLGSGGQGLLNPRLLLYLLTYLGIPLGSIVFLILLDMVSPRR
ncbi:MAG: type II secretion system F family protein [Candidatus Bathyarchaeota archaeon]|jgi:flagellar protein FlaJ